MSSKIPYLIFFCYLLGVIWLTFFFGGMGESREVGYGRGYYNLTPFKNIIHFLDQYSIHGPAVRRTFLLNLLGNLVLLLPAGSFVYWLFPRTRSLGSVLLLAFLVPLLIETLQVAFQRGIWDIDDIFLNACGWMLGYGFAIITN